VWRRRGSYPRDWIAGIFKTDDDVLRDHDVLTICARVGGRIQRQKTRWKYRRTLRDRSSGSERTFRKHAGCQFIAATLLGSATTVRAQDLPEGDGRQIVAVVCGGCHDINRIRVGYSPAGWQSVAHMMQNMEAPVQKDECPVVTAYLTKNFPERPKPAAVLIDGPVQVNIKEWPVANARGASTRPTRYRRRHHLV
jgi:hypothetical protein